MGWFGKLIGGAIGLGIGGPIGAAIGAGLGHLYDQSEFQQLQFESVERKQALFYGAFFSMLGKIAKADGVVCEKEILIVEELMRKLHMSREQMKLAISIFNEAKDSEYDISEYAKQFSDQFGQQHDMVVLLMSMLLTVSYADGVFHSNEEKMIISILPILGISDYEFQSLKAQFNRSSFQGSSPKSNKLKESYEALGVSEDASEDEIKKAYRAKINEYHPDKVMAKGLPEEFLEFAKTKTQEITEAYQRIKNK